MGAIAFDSGPFRSRSKLALHLDVLLRCRGRQPRRGLRRDRPLLLQRPRGGRELPPTPGINSPYSDPYISDPSDAVTAQCARASADPSLIDINEWARHFRGHRNPSPVDIDQSQSEGDKLQDRSRGNSARSLEMSYEIEAALCDAPMRAACAHPASRLPHLAALAHSTGDLEASSEAKNIWTGRLSGRVSSREHAPLIIGCARTPFSTGIETRTC